MTSLSDHESSKFTRLLLIGESGTGKTGALTSLVKAGYNLRILDWDNGLDSLKMFVKRDCPDRISSIEYRTLRDVRKASPLGPIIPGGPKAFIAGLKMLDQWKYDTVDLGSPAEWGPECILVLDSLSFMSDAAEDWARTVVPSGPKGQDGRAVIGEAQRAIESMLGLLTNQSFGTNVIVTAHVTYNEMPDGSKKGVPVAPGQKLSAIIPRYFNSVALAVGDAGGKRSIKTVSTGMIDLKNPAPFTIAPSLPIETALADFFKAVRA